MVKNLQMAEIPTLKREHFFVHLPRGFPRSSQQNTCSRSVNQAQLFSPQRSRFIGRCTREFPHASGHSTCCWACCCVPRYQFTCCQCTKVIHFLTCTRIPCRDSHCENGLVRCGVHTTRRLQQTAVSCKRSNCNKPKKS